MRHILITFVASLIFLQGACASESLSTNEALEKFQEASLSYNKGLYEEAIKEYEHIVASGFKSGPIYYNLGNSYYKNGQLGQAILNYERALLYTPRDSDLIFNYRYARRKSGLRGIETPSNILNRAIKGHIEFYSISEMFIISTLLFAFFIGIHLISLHLRWSRKVQYLILGIIGSLLITFVAGIYIKHCVYKNLAVSLKATDARFEPREEATTHFVLKPGERVTINQSRLQVEEWYKIQRKDGKQGWVSKQTIGEI